MNVINTSKHWLKQARWRYRRTLTAFRWSAEILENTPSVLGNAMPKSGSHLINQVIQGLIRLGPFVNPGFPPVNRDEVNEKLPEEKIIANLNRMRSGDIGYGYLKARQPFITLLTQPGRAMVFVYRDPRDMIISHVFYATQMHTGHGMHRYYTETLKSMEERIDAAIQGVDQPGAGLSPILSKYEGYLDWLEQPDVLCLRFEELILERNLALERMLDFLVRRGFHPSLRRDQEIEILNRAIAPKKSGTFRKGQPGNWREHFTPANVVFFKEHTGDLLLRLGYEMDTEWNL